MSNPLETVPDKYSPILGRIKITDVNETNYYLSSSDTSFKVSIGYAVDSDDIQNTIFKYRINGGTFAPDNSSYVGYQDSHTFTGVSLNQGDLIETIITIRKDETIYLNYPRVPAVIEVLQREALSDVKLIRRDFATILKNIGFNVHAVYLNPDIYNCPCIDSQFGRPNAYCEDCDGTGISGGYGNASLIKIILQEQIPYALHGDAIIYTKIGVGERGDVIIYGDHTIELKAGDILFFKNYRWKVLNAVGYNVGGAWIYTMYELTREFGMEDVEK